MIHQIILVLRSGHRNNSRMELISTSVTSDIAAETLFGAVGTGYFIHAFSWYGLFPPLHGYLLSNVIYLPIGKFSIELVLPALKYFESRLFL